METDPFEDFEMKPITKGLGFHKKNSSLKDSVKKTNLVGDKIGSRMPSAPPDELLVDDLNVEDSKKLLNEILESINTPSSENKREESNSLTITEPLGAISVDPTPEVAPHHPVVEDMEIEVPQQTPMTPTIKESFIEENTEETGARRGAADSPMRQLEVTTFSVSSSILDGVMVLAISLVFLVSLIMVTGVDLLTVFTNAATDVAVQISVAVMYVAVYQMYVIVSRSFFGKTLGEWTFELQLGDEEQHQRALYPVLVLWRSVLVVLTGIVLLPLLSVISRRDLASYLTGLQLYKKKTWN